MALQTDVAISKLTADHLTHLGLGDWCCQDPVLYTHQTFAERKPLLLGLIDRSTPFASMNSRIGPESLPIQKAFDDWWGKEVNDGFVEHIRQIMSSVVTVRVSRQ